MRIMPKLKPPMTAVSAAFAVNLVTLSALSAAENPFAVTDIGSGYQVAESHEGKCGEGKCGAGKMKGEGKCGEGKCGMTMMDTDNDGTVSKDEYMAAKEANFAKMDANSDGVLSADEMKAREGKCGEGKCGATKKKDK